MNNKAMLDNTAKLADGELLGVVGGTDWDGLIRYLQKAIPGDQDIVSLKYGLDCQNYIAATAALTSIATKHPELIEDIRKY